MKRILILSSLLFITSLCFSQGFDKEMVAAGKKFHKDSKKVGRSPATKQKRISTSTAGRSSANEPKRTSALDSAHPKKKNRARKRSHHHKGD